MGYFSRCQGVFLEMGRCIFGRFQGVFFEIPRAIPGYAEGYLYTHRQATSRGLVTDRSNPSYIYI